MGYLFLLVAILGEVGATLSLKAASRGNRKMYAVVGGGYVVAFTLLALSLRQGIPLGVAYGIWAALGVALTAVLSWVIYKEPLTKLMLVGIGLILIGILLIELTSPH
ncbi:MAG: QacE family quaternary ammonium compound efflux SMR transporter [Candidatus Nanopelagicales bacterium]|nr:QacE family quaternary ammonium compound efflux SMR transporter [Candidatus Nanopelagicales bacterium]MCF8551135.1 QacE family quaternary ammonium compound efflux SMR transporter [Candidatus Nanopelagicales bacterium]